MMTPRPAAMKTTMKPMMSDTRPPYMRAREHVHAVAVGAEQCSALGLA